MRIAVVGGGPGGLYFAGLWKPRHPHFQIDLFKQNAAGDEAIALVKTLDAVPSESGLVGHQAPRFTTRYESVTELSGSASAKEEVRP